MNKEFWYSIKKNNYTLPAGHEIMPLTDAPYPFPASTDPELRDIISFLILKNWPKQGIFSSAELRSLVPRLLANLQKGIGGENDFVYLCSFSGLWLAVIVDYDVRKPSMKWGEITALKEAATAYLALGSGQRGYDPVKGRSHATDHAANLLAAPAGSQPAH